MCSSPDSETMISTVSPIADLIRHVKYSFRERVFNEVQNILTDRESRMKSEIEALARQLDSAEEEARNSRRKCEELEETIAELLQENRVSSDREKRAEERNSKLVSELNATIGELKLENAEANKTIGDLGLKQSQSEFNQRRLEDLGSRIVEIEELLSDMLSMKVRDPAIASVVSEMCKLVTSGGGEFDVQDFRGKNDDYLEIGQAPMNSNEEGPRASSATMSGEVWLSKIARSSTASGDLTDSDDDDDDEANPVGEKEMAFENLFPSPSSCHRSGKRDRAGGLSEDILPNGITKRKRNTCSSHGQEDNNNNTDAVSLIDTYTTSPQKLDSSSDEDSTDSDGSCSDSKISDLIANLKSKKH